MADDSNIMTFMRIRPSKNPSGYISVDELEPTHLKFNLPSNFKSDYINNSKKNFGFKFNGILPMSTNQEEVFQKVGTAAVANALDGYNSTIFACKQPNQ